MIIKFVDFLNENLISFHEDVLNFIRKYLGINSVVKLQNRKNKLNINDLTQSMAGVYFPDHNGVYTIYINFNETKYGFVRRLAHEMVHVKQIEDGRLIKIDNDTFEFEGEVYNQEKYKSLYHSDTIPKFEEEAFDMERVIANNFWNANSEYE